MDKRKNKPLWVLFLVLLILFLIGLTCEFILKFVTALSVSHPGDPQNLVFRRVLNFFGDQATPLWLLPSAVLNWMTIYGKELLVHALRWLPYLVAFLLPVFCALFRNKALPLIPCAVLSGIAGAGVLLTCLFRNYPTFTYAHAIPFLLETLLLILACIALGTKKKAFCIILGVFFALFALLSIPATAAYAGMDAKLFKYFDRFGRYMLIRMRDFPHGYATSMWPIHKAFAFVMYALILFVAPKRFTKRVRA